MVITMAIACVTTSVAVSIATTKILAAYYFKKEQETKTREIRIGSSVRTKTIPLGVADKAIHAEDGTNCYETKWNTKVENPKIREETLRSLSMYPLALVGPFSTIQKEKGKNLWEGRSKIYEEITYTIEKTA